jgi:hypothetical protein
MHDYVKIYEKSIQMNTNRNSLYGYCPHCKSEIISRERRINGNDTCKNGHIFPSSAALKTPLITIYKHYPLGKQYMCWKYESNNPDTGKLIIGTLISIIPKKDTAQYKLLLPDENIVYGHDISELCPLEKILSNIPLSKP